MALSKVASPLVFGATLLGLMIPYAAQTAPADVILVAGGCGPGFHRGPYGHCVPNGPVVGPPVVVAPRLCPPGYRLGPYGRRCVPVGAYYPPPPGYGPPPGYAPPPGGPPPPGEYSAPPGPEPAPPPTK